MFLPIQDQSTSQDTHDFCIFLCLLQLTWDLDMTLWSSFSVWKNNRTKLQITYFFFLNIMHISP